MDKKERNDTQQIGTIELNKISQTLKVTGFLYFTFSLLTLAVIVNYFSGAWLLFQYMARGFVFLNLFQNYVLPIGVLPLFYNFLILYLIFRFIIGVLIFIFRKTPKKSTLLNLFALIDFGVVVFIGIFAVFFVDGFGFVWYPILSLVPAMLLLDSCAKLEPEQGKTKRFMALMRKILSTLSMVLISVFKRINTLKTTGFLYILFSILTIAMAVNYFTGTWLFFQYMPRGFVHLNAVRNYALPMGALPLFYNFLFLFFAFRLLIGVVTIRFRKTPKKGALLGLLGKIDFGVVIAIGIFAVFFVDGFGFVWFPVLSLMPVMLLLSGSAKLDDRPGRAARKEARTAKIFLIPAFLGLSFMTYIPLTAVFVISLYEWNFPFAPEFAGFTNLINLFSPGSFFWTSVRVTIAYASLAVIMGMIYSMAIALLLNRKIPGRAFFRTVFYLPFVIPVVSSMMIFGLIYSHGGIINNIINMFGGNRVHFLLDNATIIPAIAIIAVWASGNTIVIKMAGLANVPRTYLESAEIDGANAWQRFWRITIPCMTPIIFYNLLMSLITHMQVVVPSLMLAGGGQAGATVIPQSFRFVAFELYTTAFSGGFLGRAGAISFALFILIGIFTAILFATSKSWLFYEGGGPA